MPDHAAQSHALLADTSREFERLATELAAVLTPSNAAADWRAAKDRGTFSWSGTAGQSRPGTDQHMDEDDFDGDGVVPANTKAWLNSARRARRRDVLRRTGAWIVTLGIAGLIITLAYFLVTGGLPDISMLFPSIF